MLTFFIIASLLMIWAAWKADKTLFDSKGKADTKEPDLPLDPWETVMSEAEMDAAFSDRYPLCVNCVHPESAPIWFCHKCGCPTGHYTPYMPYLRIYWMGWLFRSGVDGSIKLTKFRTTGLLLSSINAFSLFFPLYIYRMIRNGCAPRLSVDESSQATASDELSSDPDADHPQT